MQSNDSVAFGKKRSAASNPPFSLALVTPPKLHLENGHPVRYSGRMFTYCATAAPTRHPLGVAPSLPAPPPLMTAFGAPPLGVLACLGGAAARSPVFSRPIASSPCRSCCRPSCRSTERRNSNPLNHFRLVSPKTHEATPRDTRRHATPRPAGVGNLWPLAAFHAKQASQWPKAPDPLNVSTGAGANNCRSNQHGVHVCQLAVAQVAAAALAGTAGLAAKGISVAQRSERKRNQQNSFRLLSPKAPFATEW